MDRGRGPAIPAPFRAGVGGEVESEAAVVQLYEGRIAGADHLFREAGNPDRFRIAPRFTVILREGDRDLVEVLVRPAREPLEGRDQPAVLVADEVRDAASVDEFPFFSKILSGRGFEQNDVAVPRAGAVAGRFLLEKGEEEQGRNQ